MTQKGKKYLVDIQRALRLISDFIPERSTFQEYQNDFKTRSAVERQLGIIGEAVNQFGKVEDLAQISGSRKMIDFRNRIIHSYDNIDDSIVWVIVQKHLPILSDEVQQLLEKTNQ